MHEPPVIVNNTPLVALWTLGQLALLRDLYGTAWIPQAVEIEFLATERSARQQALSQATWIQTIKLQDMRHALAYVGLGPGEAEVLALAIEQEARLVIIDERKARRYAQRFGLPLTGTLGVLLLAKERGLIPIVGPLITQLQTAGLYLDPALISKVLTLAQET
jgi:predicted nucleic acid-binding protein